VTRIGELGTTLAVTVSIMFVKLYQPDWSTGTENPNGERYHGMSHLRFWPRWLWRMQSSQV
jgi:hypothetical protein